MSDDQNKIETDNLHSLLSIETTFLKYHADEVLHHRTKLRFLLSFFITASTAILIFQQNEFFVEHKSYPQTLDWPILMAASLVLTMTYYALMHHCVKLLSKCATRDYHANILYKIRNTMFPTIICRCQPERLTKSLNISVVSGPLGILFGGTIGWFAVLKFVSKLSQWTTGILIVSPDQEMVFNIRMAERITTLTLVVWSVITVVGVLAVLKEYWRYHRIREQMKRTIWKGKQSSPTSRQIPWLLMASTKRKFFGWAGTGSIKFQIRHYTFFSYET